MGNALFIADTYNHKLKKVDISKNSVTTLCGSEGDAVDGDPNSFREPGGLCVSADEKKLYVADTNNHCIKVVLLDKEFSVRSIRKLDIQLSKKRTPKDKSKYHVVHSRPVNISVQGGKLIFDISIKFEDGLKLTDDAVQKWNIDLPNALWSSAPNGGVFSQKVDVVVTVPPMKDSPNESVDLMFHLLTCTKDTCLPKNFIIEQPIAYLQNGTISATHAIEAMVKLSGIVIN